MFQSQISTQLFRELDPARNFYRHARTKWNLPADGKTIANTSSVILSIDAGDINTSLWVALYSSGAFEKSLKGRSRVVQ